MAQNHSLRDQYLHPTCDRENHYLPLTIAKKNAVIYQIYPQSFVDSNNDGIGDLGGVMSKLAYLQTLGVDYIWLAPIFQSPLVDNGYDIANYRQLHPRYGTNEDLKTLIKVAQTHNIKIILDMVWNHSSSDHIWFQKALRGESEYQKYYYFQPASDDQTPPSDWKGGFNLPTWTYVKALNQFYFHAWSPAQPDLNWHHKPLRKQLKAIATYWMQQGVGGFRFDVFNLIGKKPTQMHRLVSDGYDAWDLYGNGIECHGWWQELGRELFWKHDLLTIGEGNESVSETLWYTMPWRRSLHGLFNFAHIDYQWTKPGDHKDSWSLKVALMNMIEVYDKGGHMALAFNNHDNPRLINKMLGADMTYHYQLATALATLQMFWHGNACIYQGDEFGMVNAGYQIGEYHDLATLQILNSTTDPAQKQQAIAAAYWTSRDQARPPVVWNDQPDHGFGSTKPWIAHSHFPQYNLKADKAGSQSIFKWYQQLIQFRRQHGKLLQQGDLHMLYKKHESLFAFYRQNETMTLKVFLNLSTTHVELTPNNLTGKIIFNNYPTNTSHKLFPYQALVIVV